MQRIVRTTVVTVMAMLFIAVVAAQDQAPKPQGEVVVKPTSPYDGTKAQLAYEREQNLQLRAARLTDQYQKQLAEYQTKWNQLHADVNSWTEMIRAVNGWDQSYHWDPETDQWTHVPKPKSPAHKK